MLRQSALAVLALLTVVLPACTGGERFTRERYETVYRGQPAEAVEQALGEPTVRYPDRWQYIHTAPYYRAVIRFEDGKVVDKEWSYARQEAAEPAPVEAEPMRAEPATDVDTVP